MTVREDAEWTSQKMAKKKGFGIWDAFSIKDARDMKFRRQLSYEQWIMDHVILGTLEAGGRVTMGSFSRKDIEISPELSRHEIAALIIEKRPDEIMAVVPDPDLIGTWDMRDDFNYHLFKCQEGFEKIEFGDRELLGLMSPAGSADRLPRKSDEQKFAETILAAAAKGKCLVLERPRRNRRFPKLREGYERRFVERNVSRREIIRRLIAFRPEIVYPVATRRQEIWESYWDVYGKMDEPRWRRKEHWEAPKGFDWNKLGNHKWWSRHGVSRQDRLPLEENE